MSKILIIEDEEPIRRVLVRILSDEDSSFEIQEASDGKKGIDLIKKESFDLVNNGANEITLKKNAKRIKLKN